MQPSLLSLEKKDQVLDVLYPPRYQLGVNLDKSRMAEHCYSEADHGQAYEELVDKLTREYLRDERIVEVKEIRDEWK